MLVGKGAGAGGGSAAEKRIRRRDMICDIHPAVIPVKQKSVSGRYHVIKPKLLPRPALFFERYRMAPHCFAL